MPRALITGITGQDGSYLAEELIERGYEVIGLVRRTSSPNTLRIEELVPHDQLTIATGDVTDAGGMIRILREFEPDEVYNLAAQSDVALSFETPAATTDVTGKGALNVLEAIRILELPARYYQAGSSEMFGHAPETPQRETTRFEPRSPYAVAKVFSHHITELYRSGYGIFACNGILFNHESPRRGLNFSTRRITNGVARIVAGKADRLVLGNLDARRDWGYAPEYVHAMWLMLQQDEPGDYVIATGENHSVRDFAATAFALVGLDWCDYVEVSESQMRPVDVPDLLGDASYARERLGWAPATRFPDLVKTMLASDLREQGVNPESVFRD